MNLQEKINYVKENINYVPLLEREKYREKFIYGFIKNSSCIEGDNITLAQVMQVVNGKNSTTESNIQRSVYNNYQAYLMIEERALNKEALTEEFFKDVHECLMKELSVGGLYRNVDIKIKGSNYTPCTYLKVYDRMGKFFYDINNFTGSDLDLVAYTHLQISKIHPFLDGNGRMARLAMNYQLMKLGMLPILFSTKERERYFDALEDFKVNKTDQLFKEFLIDHLNKEYDRFIEYINLFKKN